MKRTSISPFGFGICIAALAAALATGAIAQTGVRAPASEGSLRSMPDMRLWSFGECDNRFPYTDSEEHKECVRVVGSPEAKDARALRVCETSHSRDPAEVARCKTAYYENKSRAAQHGYTPDATAKAPAPPTEEDLQRVRAIATAAVERDRAAAAAAAPPRSRFATPEPAEQEAAPRVEVEESGTTTIVIALSVGVLLLGIGAVVSRRKALGALSGR
jgi:hypothetical protein